MDAPQQYPRFARRHGISFRPCARGPLVQKRRLILYDRSALLAALEPDLLRRIALLEIHDSLPSTNERLLNAIGTAPEGDSLAVCLANHQTAGKGRGEKKWHSPPGAGLLLSVSRRVSHPPDSSLTLALGVEIAEALETFINASVALKWPNDLLADGRKLGGILVESASAASDCTLIVAGLGVNIRVTDPQRRQVAEEGGLAPAALEEFEEFEEKKKPPERNTLAAAIRRLVIGEEKQQAKKPLERHALAAAMIAAVAEVLLKHPEAGFGPWQESWHQRDWLSGRRIEAHCGSQVYRGTAGGVDSAGALLLAQPAGVRRILSAEIRL